MTTRVDIPDWVAQVFPDYFENAKKGAKRAKRGFSKLEVLHNDIALMANTSHTQDPKTLVSYAFDHGALNTSWLRPMGLMSPPMMTSFPRLSGGHDDNGNQKPPELDLTMRGAGPAQDQFKNFMDQMDEHLLDFMVAHQVLLGKRNLPRDAIAMSQRPLFKSRVSAKTGKQYPDAICLRYKNKDGSPLLIVDKDNNPLSIDDVERDGLVRFNTIVRVSLRFSGAYCKGGNFGNSFELTGVQVLGQAENERDQPMENPFCPMTKNDDEWPALH